MNRRAVRPTHEVGIRIFADVMFGPDLGGLYDRLVERMGA